MIAYLDTSVVLRLVLGKEPRLEAFDDIELGIASTVVEVECLRTLDRLRFAADLDSDAIALRREAVFGLLSAVETIDPSPAVLRRASQPLPTPVGTLDAIHLSTALLWRDARGRDPVFATHDRRLASAARASGLKATGV